jgi:predicted dehydrogenase
MGLPGASLRVGIIGAGFMASVHATAARTAGARVVAVAGRTAESGEAAAVRLGAERASRNAAELIGSDDVDVVHICTPNDRHAEYAALALEAGKAVVCEKPLSTDAGSACALAALAQERGAITAVPFVYRFYPAVREARARLTAGEAGRLWLLHGSYLQDWLARGTDSDWRVDPAVGGGSRAFGDIGVHWCDLMEFVTGHRIARLVASTARAFEHRTVHGRPLPVDTEDGAALVFETDRGALGSVVVSQVSPGRKNRLWFSFEGTSSSFEFDQEQPETLRIGDTTATRRLPVGPGLGTEQGRRYAGLPAGHPLGYQDAFTAFVADVFRAVCGDVVEGLPTFADGHRAARITDAVLASATTDGWVDVEHPVEQRSREMEHR